MTRKDDQVDDFFSRVEKALVKKELNIPGYRASDVRVASHIPYGILTRMPQLDLAMGRPGYPVGRVIELYGLPYCGKSTAGFLAIAEVQKQGGLAILIDTETAFEPMRAAEIGVDIDNLKIYSPETIQETFTLIGQLLDALVNFTKPIVIVVDSVTAVPTKWQGEKGLTNQKPGELAQAIKMGMKMITSKVAKKKALLLLVNHAHETMAAWGKKTKSDGGHAIKFFSSNRIEFKHAKTLKNETTNERLGQEIKVNIEKLKVAKLRHPDFKINLMVDGGFDTMGSLLEAMISIGMVKHPKGSQIYTLETGTEFAKIEWPQVVADNGGLDALYEHFIKEACARGHMIPWGSQENG